MENKMLLAKFEYMSYYGFLIVLLISIAHCPLNQGKRKQPEKQMTLLMERRVGENSLKDLFVNDMKRSRVLGLMSWCSCTFSYMNSSVLKE